MVRPLTHSELELLDARRAIEDAFITERLDVLHELAKGLRFADPALIVAEPLNCLQQLSDWLAKQDIAPTNRAWLIARIGYFVGECLIARFGGYWYLNTIPDSRFFARFVVGGFHPPIKPAATADPMAEAAELADQPRGRDLAALIDEISAAVVSA